MARFPLTTVSLEGDLEAALARVPASAGVAEILASDGRVLLLGRPANLRRWSGSHLGIPGRRRPGKRPPTDLRAIAGALSYAKTTSEFHQRLLYEREMAVHVPSSERRDLKFPFSLHLDPVERFPRVTVRQGGRGAHLFGPFRDRRAAENTLRFLHKRFLLRQCDADFDPDPQLPLGLACLHAQLRTCSAPCLVRVLEEDYRALAQEAAFFLASRAARPQDVEAWIPSWVSAEEGRHALVMEAGKAGVELYPVFEGAVVEEGAVQASSEDLDEALGRVRWAPPEEPRDDRAWLTAWLHLPKRRGSYHVLAGGEGGRFSEEVRRAFAQSRSGGRVRRMIT